MSAKSRFVPTLELFYSNTALRRSAELIDRNLSSDLSRRKSFIYLSEDLDSLCTEGEQDSKRAATSKEK
jgi:hypothetical protein